MLQDIFLNNATLLSVSSAILLLMGLIATVTITRSRIPPFVGPLASEQGSAAPSHTPPLNAAHCLPCTFHHDLISCIVRVGDSDSLIFYTDTGGKNFFYKSGLKKLQVNSRRNNLWEKSQVEDLLINQNFPIPFLKQFFYVKEKSKHHDGMLGREWFADKTWTFDYEQQTLSVHKTDDSVAGAGRSPVKLYLKKDIEGRHQEHLGRIEVVIDTDTLSFLFDTGAQAHLSAEAQEALGKDQTVATSFISASIFQQWSERHPDWAIIRAADQSFGKGADMIIVPSVGIGHHRTGPVEFVKREDSNFQLMTDLFMDESIIGALGGNFLAQISPFTVDYPNEAIWMHH